MAETDVVFSVGSQVIFGAGEGLPSRVVARTEQAIILAAAIAPGITRGVCEAFGFIYYGIHPLGCRERMLKSVSLADLDNLVARGLLRPAPATSEAPF